jgi:glycosyltransferase involved in cell wall biosynthesis
MLLSKGIPVYSVKPQGTSPNGQVERETLIGEGQFDLAMIASWQAATEILPHLRHHAPRTRVVIDSSDLYFLRMSRDAVNNKRRLDDSYGQETIDEINIYAEADAMLAVSRQETALISDLFHGVGRAFYVPNTVDIPTKPHPFAERRGILLIGNYHYPPNAEAAIYLLEAILPHIPPSILADHPVYIVGDGATAKTAELAAQYTCVTITGWVPSVAPYLERARVMVAPLLSGAGTRTKVIAGLIAGLPVVTTTIGAEGLFLQHTQNALIVDKPQEFAQSVVNVLQDRQLWEHLSQSGLDTTRHEHDYASVKRYLVDALDAVME